MKIKKAEDMRWIVHPFSYKKKDTEISVIHESNLHGLKSYGWFSDRKIFIYADSMYGETTPEAKKILVKHAEELCEKMNKQNSVSIDEIQRKIDAHLEAERCGRELANKLIKSFMIGFSDDKKGS